MKKVYLHLGFHKTASTSFQVTCARHVDQLKKQGLHYPLFNCVEKERYARISNHSVPLFSAFTADPRKYHVNISMGITDFDRVNEQYLKQLSDALKQPQDVVLSGEGISQLAKHELEALNAFIRKHDCEIVPFALVRSPYAFHCSATQEMVVSGEYCRFTKLAGQAGKIQRIKEVYGDDFRFVPFSRAVKFKGGPTAFVFKQIGADSSGFEFAETNVGASNEFVRVQNALNQIHPRILDGKKNPQHRRLPLDRASKNKFLLTQGEARAIAPEMIAENQFFRKNLGDAFCDKKRERAKPVTIVDAFREFPQLLEPTLPAEAGELARDAALALEDKDLRLAYRLMQLARKLRPEGPVIRQKVAQYKTALDAGATTAKSGASLMSRLKNKLR